MRKIGIFAIGVLLFAAVSCNKDKTSLAPSSTYTAPEQPTPDYPATPTGIEEQLNGNPINNKEAGGPSIIIPPRNFHNENGFPTLYNPNKEAGAGSIRNEHQFPTYYNPAKNPVRGVRNDELINTNTSDL